MNFIEARGAALYQELTNRLGNKVYAGPFKGMKLPQINGNGSPYLLGTYETELHGIIYNISQGSYDKVLNVGCSFGYYAVGLARLLPKSTVWAIDLDDSLLDICSANAEHNNIVNVCCSNASRPLELSHNDLIVMDCEGAEDQYLDPAAYDFTKTDILVELHECNCPGLAQRIIDRFKDTHAIRIIHNNPCYFDLTTIFGKDTQLEHFDNAIVTFEGRAGPTPWAWMKHR